MSIRFAPSPTGLFHLGNLRTAWISKEFSKSLGLAWVVRFEDIDKPRVLAGAREKQLEDLSSLGLIPDQILVQSGFHHRHESLFRKAIETGRVYPCTCSRKEILDSLHQMASAPHAAPPADMPIYNGRCRDPAQRRPSSHPTIAWRFLDAEDQRGRQDFIVARTNLQGGEFAPAYHWACAIDDFDGSHSLLVRASDLAHVIRQQLKVFFWAGEIESRPKAYPAVFHSSLVVGNDGHRLEKRTRGVTLDELRQRGLSPGEILQKFSDSFDPENLMAFAPEKIWGEDAEQLRLSDLGF